MAADMGDGSVEEARRALIAKVGENIGVRRFAIVSAEDHVGSYVHGSRIGVIVAMRGGDAIPSPWQRLGLGTLMAKELFVLAAEHRVDRIVVRDGRRVGS